MHVIESDNDFFFKSIIASKYVVECWLEHVRKLQWLKVRQCIAPDTCFLLHPQLLIATIHPINIRKSEDNQNSNFHLPLIGLWFVAQT